MAPSPKSKDDSLPPSSEVSAWSVIPSSTVGRESVRCGEYAGGSPRDCRAISGSGTMRLAAGTAESDPIIMATLRTARLTRDAYGGKGSPSVGVYRGAGASIEIWSAVVRRRASRVRTLEATPVDCGRAAGANVSKLFPVHPSGMWTYWADCADEPSWKALDI
jgi:hypothetical protein